PSTSTPLPRPNRYGVPHGEATCRFFHRGEAEQERDFNSATSRSNSLTRFSAADARSRHALRLFSTARVWFNNNLRSTFSFFCLAFQRSRLLLKNCTNLPSGDEN